MIISHISDIHLPITVNPNFRDLLNKRIIGFINHSSNRKKIHDIENLKVIFDDIISNPDEHTILTGDIVNLALRSEFESASDFLGSYFSEEKLSIIPGNHDNYVNCDYQDSMYLLRRYIKNDLDDNQGLPFPYLKLIDDVAIIGISSAVTSPPFMSWGRVSRIQLNALTKILQSISKENYFTILLLHHPLHRFGVLNFKGLLNKRSVIKILNRFNINLILHGHLHTESQKQISLAQANVPCFGAPSTSRAHDDKLSFLKYDINKVNDKWNLKVYRRNYIKQIKKFETQILMSETYDSGTNTFTN